MDSDAQYAGFWTRFLALIIDSFIVQFIQFFVIIPFMVFLGLSFLIPAGIENGFDLNNLGEDDLWVIIPALMTTIFSVVTLATMLQVLYYSIMEASKHQATVGKIALGIKVTDMDGNRPDFFKALARQVGKILSGMFMMIGYIIAGFTPKKQALHDILANTLVVKK